MRRQGGYGGSNVNPLVAAQMQHIAAQRMQHNPGMNTAFPGRPEVHSLDEDQRYLSSKGEAQWHWEGNDPGAPNIPSHVYKEGQGPPEPGTGGSMLPKGPDGASPYYQKQMADPKPQREGLTIKDIKGSEHEQEMEAGYQEPSLGQTLEQLEQNFFDEIMKLIKDQSDAEDDEIQRHQERTREINLQYQEKLRSVRAQQVKYREELLRREAQMRLQQYQQATANQFQHNPGGLIGGYDDNTRSGGVGESHSIYPGGYDSFRERVPVYGNAGHPLDRNQGYDARGPPPYPGSRMYNSAPGYY